MSIKITCQKCGVKVDKLSDGTWVHAEPVEQYGDHHDAMAVAEVISIDDPGDYYRRKGETGHLLSEVIWRLHQLKQYESHLDGKYAEMIDFLEKRLEMARYVGD